MAKKSNTSSNTVARIENSFIFNAQYSLTAREQKVILYLIAQIDPQTQTEFQKQVVTIKSLEKHLTKGKRTGSIYDELNDLSKRISTRQITFNSEVIADGKPLIGYVNWFSSVVPCYTESGNAAIEFEFSNKLKPFLIDLNTYARISLAETLKLGSGSSIRLFQIFRAHRDKMAQYEKVSSLSYEIDELKKLLGLAGKYEDIRNFKRDVIQAAKKQINKGTSIKILDIAYTKTGRRVTGAKFIFEDNGKRLDRNAPVSLDDLTFAENKAIQFLSTMGIESAIAVTLVSKVQGSDLRGFEDWFFEEGWKIFLTKTNQKTKTGKAGTFVKWFMDGFGTEHFSEIMEKVQARKKKLQQDDSVAWENRLEARNMTAANFRASKLTPN